MIKQQGWVIVDGVDYRQLVIGDNELDDYRYLCEQIMAINTALFAEKNATKLNLSNKYWTSRQTNIEQILAIKKEGE